MLVQNWSKIVQNWSRMVPDTPQTLLGHFLENICLKKTQTNRETSTCPNTVFFKTSGHENPYMASKINALQQKSPPRAELFGAGVIVAWAFLFRRILLSDQRIRIFSSAVLMWWWYDDHKESFNRQVLGWYSVGIRLVLGWYSVGTRLVLGWYSVGTRAKTM